MSSLAKKKLAKIFTNAKAITPYPKNINAFDVSSTSLIEKDPYPKSALTISSEAIIKPNTSRY